MSWWKWKCISNEPNKLPEAIWKGNMMSNTSKCQNIGTVCWETMSTNSPSPSCLQNGTKVWRISQWTIQRYCCVKVGSYVPNYAMLKEITAITMPCFSQLMLPSIFLNICWSPALKVGISIVCVKPSRLYPWPQILAGQPVTKAVFYHFLTVAKPWTRYRHSILLFYTGCFKNGARTIGLFHLGFEGYLKSFTINERVSQRDPQVYILPINS